VGTAGSLQYEAVRNPRTLSFKKIYLFYGTISKVPREAGEHEPSEIVEAVAQLISGGPDSFGALR
jgi:hypothetical protein